MTRIEKAVQERILVIDGAMGTMIQDYGLSENDFRGQLFANHGQDVKGNIGTVLIAIECQKYIFSNNLSLDERK